MKKFDILDIFLIVFIAVFFLVFAFFLGEKTIYYKRCQDLGGVWYSNICLKKDSLINIEE